MHGDLAGSTLKQGIRRPRPVLPLQSINPIPHLEGNLGIREHRDVNPMGFEGIAAHIAVDIDP